MNKCMRFSFLCSVFFELEQPRLKTFLSIMAIMVGLSVAVLATKHISLYGVALCLAASFSGGLRWVVMQYFMKLHMSGHNVMATLYKISPIAFLSLLPMAVMIEGNTFMKSEFMVLDPGSYSLQYLIVLFSLFGGLLASVLIFVEMVLLAVTSSMTLTVLGQVKEIIQIVLSMMVFNENLSTRSICGITFSLIAANSYRQIKMQEIRDEADRNLGIDADDKDSDDDVELLIPKNGLIGRQVFPFSSNNEIMQSVQSC
jgi:Triose-phosphate Transporter family